MKPTLYYQLEDGVPLDSFCSDAAIGARNAGIKAIGFETLPEFDPYNIVVGSVEMTEKYLGDKMKPIDRSWAKSFEMRVVDRMFIDEIEDWEYPCFIKPANEIKAWTGLVVQNKDEAKLFTQNYQLEVLKSPIIDVVSEYRVYVMKYRGIIGVKHYLGDPYISLNAILVDNCVKKSNIHLNENSYSLDFGVDNLGRTFLIEINDGWALGNYGLTPNDYYSFVKSRFLQLSGILK